MDLFQSFKRFAVEQRLLLPDSRILLAVSGGMDSMVMTALCHRLAKDMPGRYYFGIAHVNFQLRAAESDADEQLVQALARQLDWPCWCTRFDTRSYAATQGVSIQMAARSLRYERFEQLRIEHDFDVVATAHHQNDNLETFLLNFTGGAGLAGLCGIPIRQKHLIRPMAFAALEEISRYALEQEITWREAASNE